MWFQILVNYYDCAFWIIRENSNNIGDRIQMVEFGSFDRWPSCFRNIYITTVKTFTYFLYMFKIVPLLCVYKYDFSIKERIYSEMIYQNWCLCFVKISECGSVTFCPELIVRLIRADDNAHPVTASNVTVNMDRIRNKHYNSNPARNGPGVCAVSIINSWTSTRGNFDNPI